jgi:hypothetical protein
MDCGIILNKLTSKNTSIYLFLINLVNKFKNLNINILKFNKNNIFLLLKNHTFAKN